MVSTLAEASFYADHGFDDILYAYSLPFDKVLTLMFCLFLFYPIQLLYVHINIIKVGFIS